MEPSQSEQVSSIEQYIQQVKTLLDSGAHRKATELLQSATAVAPECAELWRWLGTAARLTGDPHQALAALEHARSLGLTSLALQGELALTRYALGQYESALKEIHRALEKSGRPEDLAYLHLLGGRIQEELGHPSAARKEYSEALHAVPDYFEACFASAGLASKERDFHTAIEFYRRCTEIQPQDARSWWGFYMAAKELGSTESCLLAMEKLVELHPDEPAIRYRQADELASAGRLKGALHRLRTGRRICQIPADEAQFRKLAASILERLGDTERAAKEYERAAVLTPEDIELQLRAAEVNIAATKYRRAVRIARAAVASGGDDPRLHFALGWALSELGRFSQAAASLQRAVDLEPTSPHIRSRLAWVLLRCRKPEPAIAHAAALLPDASSPAEQSHLHEILAGAYRQLGRSELHRRHLEQAVEAEETNADAQYNLGVDLMEAGELERARSHLQRAMQLNDAVETRLAMAMTLIYLGEHDAAERLLQPALDSDARESALVLLVESLVRRERLQVGLRLARQETASQPDSAPAWVALAIALQGSGDAAAAREALEHARAIHRKDYWVGWADGLGRFA